jgi:hypothetical protein
MIKLVPACTSVAADGHRGLATGQDPFIVQIRVPNRPRLGDLEVLLGKLPAPLDPWLIPRNRPCRDVESQPRRDHEGVRPVKIDRLVERHSLGCGPTRRDKCAMNKRFSIRLNLS